jgi:hypothetical protein
MAVEHSVVKLRRFGMETESQVFVNEKENDAYRSQKYFEERETYHTRKILNSLPKILIEEISDDEKFRHFCNEINDCYNTDMLLLICNTFEKLIQDQNNVRYKDYLKAKLDSWANKEKALKDYLQKLPEYTLGSDRHENGRKILISVMNSAPALKRKEQPAINPINSEVFNKIYDDTDVLVFLKSIHEPHFSATIAQQKQEKDSWLSKQASLIKNHGTLKDAKGAIRKLPWDKASETVELKFVRKVINALMRQHGDKITIGVGLGIPGIRPTKTFDRNELLVLITSNSLLLQEFKRELSLKKITVDALFKKSPDKNKFIALFNHRNLEYLNHAQQLVTSLQIRDVLEKDERILPIAVAEATNKEADDFLGRHEHALEHPGTRSLSFASFHSNFPPTPDTVISNDGLHSPTTNSSVSSTSTSRSHSFDSQDDAFGDFPGTPDTVISNDGLHSPTTNSSVSSARTSRSHSFDSQDDAFGDFPGTPKTKDSNGSVLSSAYTSRSSVFSASNPNLRDVARRLEFEEEEELAKQNLTNFGG